MDKMKVLAMQFSNVENLSGPQESFLAYSEAPNSILLKIKKNIPNFLKFPAFPLFPHVGPVAVWGLGLLLF